MAESDSILRKRQRPGKAMIDNEVLQDCALSYRARGLAAYLLSLPDDWRINLKHLAAISVEGREAVRAALKELAAAGYMIRLRERGAGGHLRTVTMIADYPAWVDLGTAQERIAGYLAPKVTGVPENRTPVEPHSGFLVGHTKDLDTNSLLGGKGMGVELVVNVVDMVEVLEPVTDAVAELVTAAVYTPTPEPQPQTGAAWVAGGALSELQREAADLFRGAGVRAANQLAALRIASADDLVWAGRMVAEYLAEGTARPQWLHGRIMRHEQPVGEVERERRYGFAVPAAQDDGGADVDTPSSVVAEVDDDPALAAVRAAWGTLLGELASSMPAAAYDTWMRGTSVLAYNGAQVVVGLPNAYARDWLENRMKGRIRRSLGGILHRPGVDVVFCVAPLGVGGAA